MTVVSITLPSDLLRKFDEVAEARGYYSRSEAFRDAVRTLKKSTPNRDVTVFIRGGTHRLTETVVFSLEDSAEDGHRITYAAYPGERPVFF